MPHGQKKKEWKEQTNKQKNLQPKKQERKQQDTAIHTTAFPQASHGFHSRTEWCWKASEQDGGSADTWADCAPGAGLSVWPQRLTE